MPFTIKKKEPFKAAITIGDAQFNLHLNVIPAEKLLTIYQNHHEFILASAKEGDTGDVAVSVEFIKDVKKTLLEVACGWDGVLDGQGQAVPFSVDALELIVDSDIDIYLQLMQVMAQMFNDSSQD